MNQNVDRFASFALTGAALLVAVLFAKRELFESRAPVSATGAPVPEMLERWESLSAYGLQLGHPDGKVVIMQFVDLQCPACRHYHQTVLGPILQAEPEDISYVFIHLPLRIHSEALPAAIAAECAGAQGRFSEFVDVTFEQQASLVNSPFHQLARDAGVEDEEKFAACLARGERTPAIERGRALADSLVVEATPTIVVNGWRFATPPTAREVTRVISAVRAGKAPFDARAR